MDPISTSPLPRTGRSRRDEEPSVQSDWPRLRERYRTVRGFSRYISEPLAPEDCVVQSMPDVSPTKWHLAHTTWFFETFILKPHVQGYRSSNDAFEYLFNSYYNAVGAQFSRPDRGLLSRPTLDEVFDYRESVDRAMGELFETKGASEQDELASLVEIGLHHEQQHQELMLTDIKHVFSVNPLYPVYRPDELPASGAVTPLTFNLYPGGLESIGHDGPGFSYDNECPRHQTYLQPFQLANRLVTNGEYLEFMNDGGYEWPEFWLSQGWKTVNDEGWKAPLYWIDDGGWKVFTLAGLKPVNPAEPVCHVSYFEADAFAAWSKRRLPTEAEWEVAARDAAIAGNLAGDGPIHPAPLNGPQQVMNQVYGDVWEWTSSPYAAYPGYRAAPGALGEYNGKFMCNQYVLRGGSCATSASHIRPTYRNFFPPDARWQFSGIRLADDA